MLARRLAGSWWVAVPVTLAAAATLPRLYDYDKVLFFPLALLAAWNYAALPSGRRLVALGAVLAVAAMYRVDSGAYAGMAAAVALIVAHGRDIRRLTAAAATLGVVVAVCVAPALVFVQTHGGVPDAFRQVMEYATREGRRTEIFSLPRLRIDTAAPLLETGQPIRIA